MKRILFSVLAILPLAASAGGTWKSAAPAPGAAPQSFPVLSELPGVVSWETLAKVKQVRAKNSIVPEFTKEISDLNGKDIKVQGFMMPLDPGQMQKHFLLSVIPPSCPYCMPAGPEGVVEVKAAKAVKYGFEPVIVSGKMSVLKDDPMGIYYRVTDAVPSSAK